MFCHKTLKKKMYSSHTKLKGSSKAELTNNRCDWEKIKGLSEKRDKGKKIRNINNLREFCKKENGCREKLHRWVSHARGKNSITRSLKQGYPNGHFQFPLADGYWDNHILPSQITQIYHKYNILITSSFPASPLKGIRIQGTQNWFLKMNSPVKTFRPLYVNYNSLDESLPSVLRNQNQGLISN